MTASGTPGVSSRVAAVEGSDMKTESGKAKLGNGARSAAPERQKEKDRGKLKNKEYESELERGRVLEMEVDCGRFAQAEWLELELVVVVEWHGVNVPS